MAAFRGEFWREWFYNLRKFEKIPVHLFHLYAWRWLLFWDLRKSSTYSQWLRESWRWELGWMLLLFLACVQYVAMYYKSVEDPDFFWGEIASGFYWKTKWETRDGNKIHSKNIDVCTTRVAIEVRIIVIMLLTAMISKLNNNNILT